MTEHTKKLLEEWDVVSERAPVDGDYFIEEDSYGAGVIHAGEQTWELPSAPRLIVRHNPGRRAKRLAQKGSVHHLFSFWDWFIIDCGIFAIVLAIVEAVQRIP